MQVTAVGLKNAD